MAKRQSISDNQLLIPSLALSAIVMVLVGVLMTSLNSAPTPETQISASQGARQLTRSTELDDLKTDLILLEEDSIDTELSGLRNLR